MASSTSGTKPTNTEPAEVSLDSVGDDIQYLILSELMRSSSSAVLAFAQSSRTLRGAALQFAYRDLVLTKGARNSRTHRAYDALLGIFRSDGNDQVARHVRSITVKDKLPADDLMLLINKISEVGTLRKLSWETPAHMPESMLDKLQKTWPDLELSVCVLDRQAAKDAADRQMDMKLLSSPLLVNLTYTVYSQGYSREEPVRTEWPQLTKAIVAGGNLRVLRIYGKDDGSDYHGVKILDDSVPEKLRRLDITSETRLPPLEELSINVKRGWGYTNYLWDAEHCCMLRDAMDWSRLRKLSFGEDNPVDFFSTFTGLVPNLKALRFGIWGRSLAPVKKFIASLTALESLEVDEAQTATDDLWPVLLKHSATLRSLILKPAYGPWYSHEFIDFHRLETVVQEFTSLERLGWDVPCKSNVDPKYLTLLSNIKLKRLDLFLHIPQEASDYSAELRQNAMGSIPAPPLSKAGAQKSAISLMESISQAQGQQLDCLTFYFTRTGYEDRAQPYLMQANLQMRRSTNESAEGDDEYEFRGNTKWYGRLSPEDEVSLEE